MKAEKTEDKDGKIEINDKIEVKYYYRKMKFNMKLDSKIGKILINNPEISSNGVLAKYEISKAMVNSATMKIIYKIVVENDGEIERTAIITYKILSGMTMVESENLGWTLKENAATYETDAIDPGEKKEYEIVLTWDGSKDNVENMTNKISLVKVSSKAGFEEIDTEDNENTVNFILGISTGLEEEAYIVLEIITLIILLVAGIECIKILRQKE